MSKPFNFVASAALASILALTGCGSQGSNDGDTSSGGAQTTTQAPAPTGPEAIRQDGEALVPGTELALGDTVTATAAQNDGDEGDYTATISLTPTEVTEGTSADFAALSDPSAYEGKIPVYVYAQMEVVEIEGGDAHTVISPGLRAWVSDDEEATALLLQMLPGADAGALCAGGSHLRAGDVPLAPGDSALNCTIFLVPEEQQLTKVTYQNNMLGDPEDVTYDYDPIAWIL